MSVGLFLISDIKTPISNFKEVSKKLLTKLNAMNWHNSLYKYKYDKNGNSIKILRTKKDDLWQIQESYYIDKDDIPYLEFNSDNWYVCNIVLYEKTCIMLTPYRYNDIYGFHKHFDELQTFRNILYEVVSFLNGTEIIFLPDNLYNLSLYLDLPSENKSYQDIKNLMIKEVPKMQTNYFDLSCANKIENEFVLDTFDDLRDGKPYPKKETILVLGYIEKEPFKYDSDFEAEFAKEEFHYSYQSKYKIHKFTNLIENLKSRNSIFINEFNIFRKKVKKENTKIEFALYINEQELDNIDIHNYFTDDLDVAKARFRTTIQLDLSAYLLGKTEINKDFEVVVIYDDFKDLENKK